ncbi:hypothetical protein J6590_100986 [Homalodisca vitripennis]|nr:hypothetical protein J6590_100986 [Homalodisca vitripennis]
MSIKTKYHEPPDEYLDRPPDGYLDRPPDEYLEQLPSEYLDQPPDKYLDEPPDKYLDEPPDWYLNRPPDRYLDEPQDKYLNQARRNQLIDGLSCLHTQCSVLRLSETSTAIDEYKHKQRICCAHLTPSPFFLYLGIQLLLSSTNINNEICCGHLTPSPFFLYLGIQLLLSSTDIYNEICCGHLTPSLFFLYLGIQLLLSNEIRAKKPSQTHNSGTKGLKVTSVPPVQLEEFSCARRALILPFQQVNAICVANENLCCIIERISKHASFYQTKLGLRSPPKTLNSRTKGLKVTSVPPVMAGQTGCLQGQDRSAIIHPSSSHARRYWIQLSCDNRHTRFTAPLTDKIYVI